MISLFLEKYFHLKNLTVCGKNQLNYDNWCQSFGDFKQQKTKLKQIVLKQILFKFRVNAIESDSEVQNKTVVNNNNINSNNVNDIGQSGQTGQQSDPIVDKDLHSKEHLNKIKTMSIWESIIYLMNRKVDTKDDQYLEQFLKEGETGEDRVRLMFSEYLSGQDNPEMRFIMNSLGFGMIAGAVYGGIVSNKTTVTDFVRRHNEFVFRGDFEAKRKIRDSMYLNFIARGARWSWRIGLFTCAFSGLTTVAIAYRNQVRFTDCMFAGALVCGLWKMKLGMRAMAVSSVVGSIFGAILASSLKVMLWSMNTTVPEYRHWRHLRYLGYLEVEKYSDGTTQYGWNIENKDTQKQPDYKNLTPNTS